MAAPASLSPQLSKIAMIQAAGSGDHATVQQAMRQEGWTTSELQAALENAAFNGRADIVRILLDNGGMIEADVVLRAAWGGSIEVFEALVERGLDLNEPFSDGARLMPSVISSAPLTNWFLEHGADLNAPNTKRGTTGSVLQAAARASDPMVFEILLRHGAKLDESSPLHCVAQGGAARIPMMEYLLTLGIDDNSMDVNMGPWSIGTPLHYAIRAGDLNAAAFLLRNGADASMANRAGRRPVDEAGNLEMMKLLETYAKTT